MRHHPLPRRTLLQAGAAIGAAGFAPAIVPSTVLGSGGRGSPGNRIVLGNIGIGGEGTRNLMAFLGQPDAQVVAVCDVDPQRRNGARDRVNRRYQTGDCACYVDSTGTSAGSPTTPAAC